MPKPGRCARRKLPLAPPHPPPPEMGAGLPHPASAARPLAAPGRWRAGESARERVVSLSDALAEGGWPRGNFARSVILILSSDFLYGLGGVGLHPSERKGLIFINHLTARCATIT